MSKSLILVCALILTTLLGACARSDTPTAEPAAAAAAPAAAATATMAGTGVAECDQFLDAYEQCLTAKVPAQAREQMQAGVAQWRSAWRDMAGNATTRDSLPQVCQQARASTKPVLDAYGCTL